MPSGYHSSWSGAAGWVIANQRADNYYYVQFTAVFAPLNGSNTAYLDHINIDYWGWGTDRACGGQVWIYAYETPSGGYNTAHNYRADEGQCWSIGGAYGQWNYVHRTVLTVHQWYKGGQPTKNGIDIQMSTNRTNMLAGTITSNVKRIDFIRL